MTPAEQLRLTRIREELQSADAPEAYNDTEGEAMRLNEQMKRRMEKHATN